MTEILLTGPLTSIQTNCLTFLFANTSQPLYITIVGVYSINHVS